MPYPSLSSLLSILPLKFITFKRILNLAAIFLMLIGLVYWYILLILGSIVSKINTNNNNSSPKILPMMELEFFFYFFAFLPLCYTMRRGVRKESVPLLQYTSTLFILLQSYGILIQLLNNYRISSFLIDPPGQQRQNEAEAYRELLIEICAQGLFSILFLLLVYFYIEKLKSHFYIPPVYPCRVEYFYYPDENTQGTEFNSPFAIQQFSSPAFQNTQTYAYFVEKGENGQQYDSNWKRGKNLNLNSNSRGYGASQFCNKSTSYHNSSKIIRIGQQHSSLDNNKITNLESRV